MAVLISVTEGDVTQIVLADVGVQGATGPSSPASGTAFTPYGNIAATNVQTAIQELDDEKFGKAGGTVTGNLEIGTGGTLSFEGATADGFETTLAVVDPTADRTLTLPNVTGTFVTTGDTGTVTSTMLLDGTILNADVNASAAIAGTKISPDFGSQTIVTTGVHSAAAGSAAAPSITFTGDLDTGIYSLGANQVAVATAGSGRLFIDSSGRVGIGTTGPSSRLEVGGESQPRIGINSTGAGTTGLLFQGAGTTYGSIIENISTGELAIKAGASGQNSYFITFGTNDGTEYMRLTSAGLLGLGTSSPESLLHVLGEIKGGASSSINGTTILSDFYTSGTSLGSLGIERSSGALVLTTNAKQAENATGYVSTNTLNLGKAALKLDSTGLFYATASASVVPIGNSVSLTDRFVITNAGNVGIGTTSPGKTLEVSTTSSTDGIALSRAGSNRVLLTADGLIAWGATANQGTLTWDTNQAIIRAAASNSLLFAANNSSEHARIDTSGRLLVGTSTARTASSYGVAGLQVESTNFQTASISAVNNQNTSDGVALMLGKSRGTTIGSNTIVQNGDFTGYISFQGADGAALKETASIYSVVDGTPGVNDMPGRLVFSTTADGAASPTERMRIKSNGIINFSNAPTYADNTAATAGGLAVGDVYQTVLGVLMIRF
jgi:hypothetical protein